MVTNDLPAFAALPPPKTNAPRAGHRNPISLRSWDLRLATA
jgi:hypothetical protein